VTPEIVESILDDLAARQAPERPIWVGIEAAEEARR